MTFQDFKWPLIIFLIGVALQFIGALVKIRHWPGADEIITASTIICVIAIIIAIIKIATFRNRQQ